MAWQDDLAAVQARQHDDVIVEATAIAEAARARTPWAERVQAASTAGAAVGLTLAGGTAIEGVVSASSAEVIEVVAGEVTWLVRPAAVVLATGLPGVLSADVPSARVPLTWAMALRPWTGTLVTMHVAGPASGSLTGELTGVGADHLDIRTAAPVTVVTVPAAAIAAVRCG